MDCSDAKLAGTEVIWIAGASMHNEHGRHQGARHSNLAIICSKQIAVWVTKTGIRATWSEHIVGEVTDKNGIIARARIHVEISLGLI